MSKLLSNSGTVLFAVVLTLCVAPAANAQIHGACHCEGPSGNEACIDDKNPDGAGCTSIAGLCTDSSHGRCDAQQTASLDGTLSGESAIVVADVLTQFDTYFARLTCNDAVIRRSYSIAEVAALKKQLSAFSI